MKVAVAYCYPLVKFNVYFPLAKRFADTWRKFPPGIDHELHLVCNGGAPHDADLAIFKGIPHQVHARDNFGWDIGAFQWMAEHVPCDLLVCLGAPVHFHRSGWLERMVDAYIEYGPNLYGCWAYLSPNWHVRTTVFWLHPELLNTYPDVVGSDKRSRYEFEHGNKSLTRHVLKLGLECLMVTWDGVYPFSQWTKFGPDAMESLVHDQFTNKQDPRLRDRPFFTLGNRR